MVQYTCLVGGGRRTLPIGMQDTAPRLDKFDFFTRNTWRLQQ